MRDRAEAAKRGHRKRVQFHSDCCAFIQNNTISGARYYNPLPVPVELAALSRPDAIMMVWIAYEMEVWNDRSS